MSLAEAPFDLVDVKLAAPFRRPGTVAKASAIARLCASRIPLVTVIEWRQGENNRRAEAAGPNGARSEPTTPFGTAGSVETQQPHT